MLGLTGCGGGNGNDSSKQSAEQAPGGNVAETVAATPSTISPLAPSTTARRTAPRAGPTLTLEPATVEAGEQDVRVHGRNWGRRISVTIRLVDPGPPRGEFLNFDVSTDAQGSFLARFIVPSEVAPGQYVVDASGPAGSGVADAPLKVVPSKNADPGEGY